MVGKTVRGVTFALPRRVQLRPSNRPRSPQTGSDGSRTRLGIPLKGLIDSQLGVIADVAILISFFEFAKKRCDNA